MLSLTSSHQIILMVYTFSIGDCQKADSDLQNYESLLIVQVAFILFELRKTDCTVTCF